MIQCPLLVLHFFEIRFMALGKYQDKFDSIDAKQRPLSRFVLSHSKAIEQTSLSDCPQILSHRLNKELEDVAAEVSWDELTGRK